jgi:hypothetical protein
MLLSAKQFEAAQHVANDRLTDEAITQLLGISRRTLGNWKNRPPFIFRVEEIKEETSAKLAKRGIREKERRIDELIERHTILKTIAEERGRAAEMDGVPGGRTGWIVRQERMIGVGKNAEKIVEYKTDIAGMAEMRNIEDKVARELGQLDDKGDVRENSSADGVIIYLPSKREEPVFTPPERQVTVIEHES